MLLTAEERQHAGRSVPSKMRSPARCSFDAAQHATNEALPTPAPLCFAITRLHPRGARLFAYKYTKWCHLKLVGRRTGAWRAVTCHFRWFCARRQLPIMPRWTTSAFAMTDQTASGPLPHVHALPLERVVSFQRTWVGVEHGGSARRKGCLPTSRISAHHTHSHRTVPPAFLVLSVSFLGPHLHARCPVGSMQ